MMDDFLYHYCGEHISTYKCNDCGNILDSQVIDFHKFYNCDDARAGLEFKKFSVQLD